VTGRMQNMKFNTSGFGGSIGLSILFWRAALRYFLPFQEASENKLVKLCFNDRSSIIYFYPRKLSFPNSPHGRLPDRHLEMSNFRKSSGFKLRESS
jgi:hypothetical protein